MKKVDILQLTVTNLGRISAAKIDFSKFGNLIKLKGNNGAGKSTVIKAAELSTKHSGALPDNSQYGDEFLIETQLSDGNVRLFVEVEKKKEDPKIYTKLFAKDENGKKYTPVIDGMKATPADYLKMLHTYASFHLKSFTETDDATVLRNFMLKIFEADLKGLGVNPLIEELEKLTETRDYLRRQCSDMGAFMTNFKEIGHSEESLMLLKPVNIQEIEAEIVKLQGSCELLKEKEISRLKEVGNKIISEIHSINSELSKKYADEVNGYNSIIEQHHFAEEIDKLIAKCDFIYISAIELFNKKYKVPAMPVQPKLAIFENGRCVSRPEDVAPELSVKITELSDARLKIVDAMERDFSSDENNAQIEILRANIENGRRNNDLIKRFEKNREWVEADSLATGKRAEINALYGKVDTGVPGLKILPFYNDNGKFELKTTYTGEFNPEYFANKEGEDRIIFGYSQTQRAVIGILLQISQMKRKDKVLNLISLDGVPCDSKSLELILEIAKENDIKIITSMSGDYGKDKLSSDEILIDGGEVFINEL